MSSFLKGGSFKPLSKKEDTSATTKKTASPFLKKKTLGGLTKKKEEPAKEEIVEKKEVKEEKEEVSTKTVGKSLNPKKKLTLGAKKDSIKEEKVIEEKKETPVVEDKAEVKEVEVKEEVKQVEKETVKETESKPETVTKEEPEPQEKVTKKSTKKTTKKNTSKKTEEKESVELTVPEVDESRRVSIEEMDEIMRPIVAPTTASWEEEKKSVLEALEKIKVEQDMPMTQVKSCLSELDALKFEILAKQHDAETNYDGTKQNYDTVKAIAIANGNGTNAETRKAIGILACKNYTTPTGQVVDLNQYMLLIEERHKFYQKVVEIIDFKRYSLVNYNEALKIEAKGL